MSSSEITKKAIADAMKTLMFDTPMAKISVGDIVEQCGLTRNSFYYHFKDKYDLVNWIFYTEILEELKDDDLESITIWSMIEILSAFFYKDKEFYINAMAVNEQNSFDEYFKKLLKELVITQSSMIFEDETQNEFFVESFIASLSGTFIRWLRSDEIMPPDEFSVYIKDTLTVAAEKLLDVRE